MPLQPIPDSLFFSKKDLHDPRLGESAKNCSLAADLGSASAADWALLGYPDDLGIAMNGGRTGAKEAPDCIRKYFYKMTPPIAPMNFALRDFGNLQVPFENTKTLGISLDPEGQDKKSQQEALAHRHQEALLTVKKILGAGLRLISLGGGHDYGFSDAAGFLDCTLDSALNNSGNMAASKNKTRPLVINFDAHLDVRPSDRGFHSGTPFYRLLTAYAGQFDFFEVGLQPQCNSPHHRRWAQDHGAMLIDLSRTENSEQGSTLSGILSEALDADPQRPLWLSVDIDAFCSAEAPGCSQSWATGLQISSFLPALRELKKNFNLRGMGIYEVSPPLDQDDRTSKLAALLMHHLIFS